MADAVTLARPYAEALFSEALSHELLDPWTQVINLLAMVIQEPSVAKLIINPQLNDNELATFFEDVLTSLNKSAVTTLGARVNNFIRLLVERKRLALLPSISQLYHQLLLRHQRVFDAADLIAYFSRFRH